MRPLQGRGKNLSPWPQFFFQNPAVGVLIRVYLLAEEKINLQVVFVSVH